MARRSYDFKARKALPQDAEQIVIVQRKAVEKAWRHAINDFDDFLREKFDHETQVKKYYERATDPTRSIIIVEMGDKIVGFGGVRQQKPDEQPTGYEYQGNAFYVDPDFEGTGASMVLITAMLADLKRLGAKSLMGWCLANNRLARNFYERRGAKLITDAVAPPEYQIAPHIAYGWKF